MVKQKCVNCGIEFDSVDCACCPRYVPGVCNGKVGNKYCIDCCLKLGN